MLYSVDFVLLLHETPSFSIICRLTGKHIRTTTICWILQIGPICSIWATYNHHVYQTWIRGAIEKTFKNEKIPYYYLLNIFTFIKTDCHTSQRRPLSFLCSWVPTSLKLWKYQILLIKHQNMSNHIVLKYAICNCHPKQQTNMFSEAHVGRMT